MKPNKSIIAAIAVAAMSVSAVTKAEATLDFSYNYSGAEPLIYGFNKVEKYDVAIRLSDPSLVGCKVAGLYVNAPSRGTYDHSGWLSTELKLDNKVNSPDIVSKAGTVGDDGMLRIDFDEPYTITEKGVYIGYSINVKEILTEFDANPIAVTEGVNPEGLYIHTSRSRLKWVEYSERLGAVSTITVRLQGEFHDNASGVRVSETLYSPVGKEASIEAILVNHGACPITTVGYSYTAGTESGSGTATLPEALDARFGATAEIALPIKAMSQCGDLDFTLTIDKVNGEDNLDVAKSADATLTVMPFVPTNRPLVEEYTGMWCGYCPVGYIALETMHKQYGGDFIAVAYHDGDDIATVAEFPSFVAGFPSSYINRGTNEVYPGDLPSSWPRFRKTVPLADIDVSVAWEDETKTHLTATSTLRFVKDMNTSDLRVGYILVEDGMSDPSWKQSNYLSGNTELTGEYADLFVNGGSKVSGLVFNDVVISKEGLNGIEGSVPDEVKMETPYSHTFTYNLSEALNLEGKVVIQDPDKLRVIAFIIDTYDREVINSNTSPYADGVAYSGLESVSIGNDDVVDTIFYDLHGRRIFKPASGIYVKSEKLSDGSFRVSKVAVK